MKILCITEVFYPSKGGTEIIFYEVFRRLVKRGFEIEVITNYFSGSPEEELLEGIHIKRLKTTNRKLFPFLALKKVFSIQDVDVLQTAVWLSAYPTAILKIFRKIPAVLMVNGYFGWRWTRFSPPIIAISNYLIERCMFMLPFDKFCCLSKFQASLIKNIVGEEKIEVTYPGVDYEIFKPMKSEKTDRFVFCYYGRCDAQKGVDILLKATKLFNEKYHNEGKLIVITPQYYEVKKLMKKNKVCEKYIELYPGMEREKIAKILKDVDVVVVPSKEIEAFGIVAAEASAMGKPVIATNKGGLKEIVIDGKTGFLISPDPEELAEKLGIFYENPSLIDKLGKNARKHVLKKFSWDKMAKQFEKIYLGLAKR
jgi:glycosyltransferase involved in cell wall biosynthesis